jgi:curved DNA-binding protein
LILGGKAEVRTLAGMLKLDIPPGTQNDKILRLKGKGMPLYNSPGNFGDLYVTVKADVPVRLSEQEKALFKQLAYMHQK